MNPEEMQTLEMGEELLEEELDPTDSLSDDDIAAALGFTTTLSEPLIPEDEMTTAEGEAVETADESPETEMAADEELEEEEPDPELDAMEDEIADIRAELEALKDETKNEQETENTEAADEAE
jgi:TolA-binding protein